jgi:hypothetical protein
MGESESNDLSEARAKVAVGHKAVGAGEYLEAHGAFSEALPRLRAVLGDEHPDVQELADDLRTVADMAGVADFGAVMGFRWSDPTDGEAAN